MSRYLVVGGVAGGASTAARLRRLDEKAEIVLFERGGYISYANCGLPYYAGGVIAERDKLFVMTPEKFRAWLNVDVRLNTEVLSIDRASKTVTARDLGSGREYPEGYDYLVLSPGAEPVRPPIPGIDLPGILTLRSVPDIDAIKRAIDGGKPERALVIGGGFIGLEMAENLHERGIFVTIVEALDQVMGPIDPEMAALVHQHLKAKGVELYLGSAVERFEKRGSRISAHLSTGTDLEADLVILSIGVRPEGSLAKGAGLPTLPNGAILVDESLRTEDPFIYALGDAVAAKHPILGTALTVPLAGPANKQARVVADNIVKGSGTRLWKGAIGTSIAKVFSITAAAAGVSEKVLKKSGIPCASIITHGSSHAGYYPGALPLTIKTIFNPETGVLLGAQVVGYDGVDKRIDLLAEVIRRKGSVVELAEIEHAYAPPFASAKDPVNIAGMVAENLLSGLTHQAAWHEVASLQGGGACILDVRTPVEFELGTIPGARNIPLDILRARLSEVPKDRTVLVFCAVGLRGYLAERILVQNGFRNVFNLSGGYKTWELATAKQSNTGLYRSLLGGPRPSSQEATLMHENFSEGSGLPETTRSSSAVMVRVDACGLQCPGPIMRLKQEIDKLKDGDRIAIAASDPGFARDAGAWCTVTGNTLLSLSEEKGTFTAMIEKTSEKCPTPSAEAGRCGAPVVGPNGATLIVFSDDMDKALASFVLANGAASSGKKVTMFFTFWGLSVIKRKKKPPVHKSLIGRMFGLMLPKHAGKLSLSKMNFGGMGAKLMKGIMKREKVDALPLMIESARSSGVRFIACQMSMDIMGVKKEELLDFVEIGGVASYMEAATYAGVNLFI